MAQVYPMNFQFFADSEVSEEVDLDTELANLRNEIEEEYSSDENSENDEGSPESDEEETDSTEETDESEETESTDDEQQQKDAQASANLRNQVKEKEQFEKFVKNLSDHYGVQPDELMNRFNEQQLEEQAKQEGTSPEILKRIRQLEEENSNIRNESFQDRFNSDVEQTLKDNKIDTKDPTYEKTIQYISENYMGADKKPTIKFSDAYKLANHDTIIQKQLEEAQQKELADKKKSQTSGAVPAGKGAPAENEDWTFENVEKYLKNKNLID